MLLTADEMNQLITIGLACIPLIGLAIDWLKRKLGEKQGDLAFAQLGRWADEISALGVVIPELGPLGAELKSLTEAASKLWEDPASNHDQLIVVMAHAEILYKQAMDLIKKYVAVSLGAVANK
jgi:hypothetical protein